MQPTEQAAPGRRFIAYLIDQVVVIGAVILLILMQIVLYGAISTIQAAQVVSVIRVVLSLLFALAYISLAVGGYYMLFWTLSGQTLGKKWLGIKVVRVDGTPLGIGRASLRAIIYMLSNFLYGLPFLFVVIDKNRQGFHDKAADTKVINA